MIFSRLRKDKQQQRNHLIKSNRYYMYLKELQEIKYDLSEQTCIFKIHDAPIFRGNYLLLNIYVKPLIGLYEDIEFRPHIYLNLFDNFQPPKILNDRKIYHPNIDFINGEIFVPEIINWNPSFTLGKQLSRLKYTLIEPNPDTVPNNQWNIDAASIFILSRDKSYRSKIIENCPAVLEERVFSRLTGEQMEDEEQSKAKKYLSFSEILPLDRTRSMVVEDDDLEIESITKQIKSIKLEHPEYLTDVETTIWK